MTYTKAAQHNNSTAAVFMNDNRGDGSKEQWAHLPDGRYGYCIGVREEGVAVVAPTKIYATRHTGDVLVLSHQQWDTAVKKMKAVK